jgi:hypothetical protein
MIQDARQMDDTKKRIYHETFVYIHTYLSTWWHAHPSTYSVLVSDNSTSQPCCLVISDVATQIERIQERCKKDKEYNLDHLSRLYESVKNYYLLRQSDRLRHQLLLINRKL